VLDEQTKVMHVQKKVMDAYYGSVDENYEKKGNAYINTINVGGEMVTIGKQSVFAPKVEYIVVKELDPQTKILESGIFKIYTLANGNSYIDEVINNAPIELMIDRTNKRLYNDAADVNNAKNPAINVEKQSY